MECLCFGIPCTGAGAAVNPGRQTGISLSPYRRAKVFFSFSLIGEHCINLSLNNSLYDWGRLSGGLAERRRVWLDMVHEV